MYQNNRIIGELFDMNDFFILIVVYVNQQYGAIKHNVLHHSDIPLI